MSADNWGKCPKCKQAKDASRLAAIDAVRKKYGKIPSEDYDELMAGAMAVPEESDADQDTLREDYEIGTNSNGKFSVGYSCHCRRCKFSFQFKHEEDALKPGK